MNPSQYHACRKTVTLSQGEISYVVAGEGPAALFVHGLMLNNSVWRQVISRLGEHRTCYAVDLMGHGRSQVSLEQDIGMESQAEMLAEFCATLGLQTVDAVANDFGGGITQIFAINNPDRLRTLTLTNCDAHYNLGPPIDLRKIVPLAKSGKLGDAVAFMLDNIEAAHSLFPGRGFQNPKNLTPAVVWELLGPGFAPDRVTADTGEVRNDLAIHGRRNFERFILSVRGDELVRIEPALKNLNIPTHLIWGTEDSYFGLPWAFWLRDTIPGCDRLSEIEGGCLFAPIERPQEVVTAMLDYW
ncbi:MAG: alpha/beta hydrolase [Robiginitomaculum sp.]|nr:alpha/beta hydrolase [Robiginitomaculum sp.]